MIPFDLQLKERSSETGKRLPNYCSTQTTPSLAPLVHNIRENIESHSLYRGKPIATCRQLSYDSKETDYRISRITYNNIYIAI